MTGEPQNENEAWDVQPTDGSFAGQLMPPVSQPSPNTVRTNPFSSPTPIRTAPTVRMQFGLGFLFMFTTALILPLGLLLGAGFTTEETLWGFGGAVVSALAGIGLVTMAWTISGGPMQQDG